MQQDDAMIDEALEAEEKALLRRIGEEPGYIDQALGIFSGRNGWVNSVLMAVQALLFVGGVWAAWQFFKADNVLAALHWGLPAVAAVLSAVTIKTALYPVIHTRRLLLELKRLELLIAAK